MAVNYNAGFLPQQLYQNLLDTQRRGLELRNQRERDRFKNIGSVVGKLAQYNVNKGDKSLDDFEKGYKKQREDLVKQLAVADPRKGDYESVREQIRLLDNDYNNMRQQFGNTGFLNVGRDQSVLDLPDRRKLAKVSPGGTKASTAIDDVQRKAAAQVQGEAIGRLRSQPSLDSISSAEGARKRNEVKDDFQNRFDSGGELSEYGEAIRGLEKFNQDGEIKLKVEQLENPLLRTALESYQKFENKLKRGEKIDAAKDEDYKTAQRTLEQFAAQTGIKIKIDELGNKNLQAANAAWQLADAEAKRKIIKKEAADDLYQGSLDTISKNQIKRQIEGKKAELGDADLQKLIIENAISSDFGQKLGSAENFNKLMNEPGYQKYVEKTNQIKRRADYEDAVQKGISKILENENLTDQQIDRNISLLQSYLGEVFKIDGVDALDKGGFDGVVPKEAKTESSVSAKPPVVSTNIQAQVNQVVTSLPEKSATRAQLGELIAEKVDITTEGNFTPENLKRIEEIESEQKKLVNIGLNDMARLKEVAKQQAAGVEQGEPGFLERLRITKPIEETSREIAKGSRTVERQNEIRNRLAFEELTPEAQEAYNENLRRADQQLGSINSMMQGFQQFNRVSYGQGIRGNYVDLRDALTEISEGFESKKFNATDLADPKSELSRIYREDVLPNYTVVKQKLDEVSLKEQTAAEEEARLNNFKVIPPEVLGGRKNVLPTLERYYENYTKQTPDGSDLEIRETTTFRNLNSRIKELNNLYKQLDKLVESSATPALARRKDELISKIMENMNQANSAVEFLSSFGN